MSYRTQDSVRIDNIYYELEKRKIRLNFLVLPDQCSRTFLAFSRYRYRDTMTMVTQLSNATVRITCPSSTPEVVL